MKQPLKYFLLKLQAITLLVFGQKRAALVRFDAMRRMAPSNRYVMASRAHLLGELGDKRGAIESLGEITRLFPDQSAGWFNLGYLLDDIGRHVKQSPHFVGPWTPNPRWTGPGTGWPWS